MPLALRKKADYLDPEDGDRFQIQRSAGAAQVQFTRDLFEVLRPHGADQAETHPPPFELRSILKVIDPP